MPPITRETDAQAYARAVRLFEAGRYGEAAAATEPILKRRPGHEQTLTLRASALVRAGRPADARRIFHKLLRTASSPLHLHHEIALTHLIEGDLRQAHDALDKAFEAEPRNPLFAAAKAELFQAGDRHEEGADVLRPLIESGEADERCRIVFAELCAQLRRTDEALSALEPVLDRATELPGPLERRARFAQVSVLDRAGRHAEAFDAAREANDRTIELRGGRFDTAAHSRNVQRAMDAWTRETIAGLARSGEKSELPVFIVGMPRSGTSLVEQILASHPGAFGAGELGLVPDFVREVWPTPAGTLPLAIDPAQLRPARLSRFARATLRELRNAAPQAQRISDKNPLNFLHLGLIAAAFPQARIVHCTRDPLDTCVSCYFLDFKGDLRFTNDLDSLGRVARDAERLITHWRETIDLPILELRYEDLVGNLERSARALIEFLDLPWDDACLRYHETDRLTRTASVNQVRQPIYASAVGRAARYGDRLDPLRTALAGDG